jgi:hypothetical protein
MPDQLVTILDRRIRDILEAAYQRASHLAAAYKVETGHEHPLVSRIHFPHSPANGRGKPVSKARSTKSGGRVRRSPEQLTKEADGIVALIRQQGTKGLSGEEIRKAFPKVGQSINQFVQKHSNGAKLRRTGKARSTLWFVKN